MEVAVSCIAVGSEYFRFVYNVSAASSLLRADLAATCRFLQQPQRLTAGSDGTLYRQDEELEPEEGLPPQALRLRSQAAVVSDERAIQRTDSGTP